MQDIQFAVIGGSGFYQFNALKKVSVHQVTTPFGEVEMDIGQCDGTPLSIAFLARHAKGHKVPPHKINYRANLWALYDLGVKRIYAINAVGGIHEDCPPGALVVPDQLIDYTYERAQTFADTLDSIESHIDFTWPYSAAAREALLAAAKVLNEPIIDVGCYGCMQGPRLETAAEIRRLSRDGNTLVGMTAMPEAALARELGIEYASLCLVANWAAGLTQAPISVADMLVVLDNASTKAQQIVHQAIVMSANAV